MDGRNTLRPFMRTGSSGLWHSIARMAWRDARDLTLHKKEARLDAEPVTRGTPRRNQKANWTPVETALSVCPGNGPPVWTRGERSGAP